MVRDSSGLLPQPKNHGTTNVTERVAAVIAIVEEGKETFLIIGDGSADFDRWRLDDSKVRKVVTEGFPIAMRPERRP